MTLYTDIQKSNLEISKTRNGEIRGEFNFSGDLELFKGHFPKKSILPGIAQIEMVKFTLEAVLEKKLTIQSITKTKFSHLIEPDTPVYVRITLQPSDQNNSEPCLISARAVIKASCFPAGRVNLVLSASDAR